MSPATGLNQFFQVDELSQGIINVAPKLPRMLLLFLIGFVIIRLVSFLARLLLSLVRLPSGLRGILVSVIDTLLWVFLVISMFQALGLNNLALIFSGGVAAIGLALGAGASSLAADILGGIFLAQDKDFEVGDLVQAGEKPTKGVIVSMDMRRTRLLDDDGHLHIIPNSVIERKEWILLERRHERRRKRT